MLRDLLGEARDYGRRKIRLQKTLDQVRIIDQRRVLKTARQIDLGKRGDDGQLGTGQPRKLRASLAQLLARRKRILALAHQATLFDRLHQIGKGIRITPRAPLLEAQRKHLVAIVAQHALRDLIGAGGEDLVAIAKRQRAALDRRFKQNLEINLVI